MKARDVRFSLFSLLVLDPSTIPPEERCPGQPPELVAVLGTQVGRHWGAVTSLACPPDGGTLFTAGSRKWESDGLPAANAVVWDVAKGPKVCEVELPGVVDGAAFAPDGRHVVTSNSNGPATSSACKSTTPAG
jgi:WD40 repeat protein